MADFGDYAGQYLTMAREMPRNAVMVGQAGEEMAAGRQQRQYVPDLMMAKFYGTPFERWKGGIEQQDVLAKQELARTAQNRLFAADEENRRKTAEAERMRIKSQDDTNAIARYKAAMEAYQAGVGPNPGPPPGSAPAPAVAAGGVSGGGVQPAMPEDLQRLPPGMRNKILAERVAEQPQSLTRIEGLTTSFDQMIDEAKQLSEHPSIVSGSGWTGTVLRNLPDVGKEGSRNFGERLKALGAQIGFNALTNMREMSKTGGALGQVSDFENRRLEAAISALDAQQAPDDIKRSLRQVINYANAAKKNMAAAYKRTYGQELPNFEKREIVPMGGGNSGQVAPQQYPTATNPTTGERIILKDGKWQPM